MRKITMNKLRQSYKSIFQLDLWTVSLPQMVQGSKLVLNRLFSQNLCFHVLSNISSIFLNKFSDILIQYIYICVRLKRRNMHLDEFDLIQISNFTKHVFCVSSDFQFYKTCIFASPQGSERVFVFSPNGEFRHAEVFFISQRYNHQ